MSKNATHEHGVKSLPYYSRWYRILAALVGACWVVLNRLKTDIRVVLANPGFYISVAFSFTIALVLIEVSHRYSLLVDRRYSWENQYERRMAMHLLVGPLFTSAMAAALAYGLITAMGRDFVQSDYLSKEFPLIVTMLFAVHLNYRERSSKYHARRLKKQVDELGERINRDKRALQTQLQYNHLLMMHRREQAARLGELKTMLQKQHEPADPPKGSIKVDFKDERITVPFVKVAYFKKEGNLVEIFMRNGKKYVTRYTLNHLANLLDDYWFFRTHVSFIVNRGSIKPCEREEGNGVMAIEMQAGTTKKHWVRVSRDRKKAYRKWLTTIKSNDG